MSHVSRTAQHMAFFRALESARSTDRLFDDPLAAHFLPPRLRLVSRAARLGALRAAIEGFMDRRWPGARASGVARTRLIDDWTLRALHAGADQVLILGAGFDSRAYRLPELASVPVFEVDQPAVVDAKRASLHAAGRDEPANVTFVSLDFKTDALGERLAEAGVDPTVRTCVIWEGVTNYLTEEAVMATLEDVRASTARGSEVIWTYVHRGVVDGSHDFDGAHASVAAVERAGEPWTFGLLPEDVSGFLARCGLRLLEDIGSLEYRKRYIDRGGRELRGYAFYRAARAETLEDA